MQFNPDETFWDDLLTYVDSGCVIPVLGQGAITYGDSDQPFYPWLARRLARKLKVSVPEDAPVPSLNDIVCRHLLAGGGSNLVYLRFSQILVAECPEPGPALRAFAEMEPFRLFLTTTPEVTTISSVTGRPIAPLAPLFSGPQPSGVSFFRVARAPQPAKARV
jgi:hypothetical protein